MDEKYFMGEIDLPNGNIRRDLVEAKDINSAHDIFERHIKISQLEFEKISSKREKSVWAPFRPIGSFLIRRATTQEILEDALTDFAGGWNEYSISGFAEEIIDIVLSTIPTKALEEEIQKRIEKKED